MPALLSRSLRTIYSYYYIGNCRYVKFFTQIIVSHAINNYIALIFFRKKQRLNIDTTHNLLVGLLSLIFCDIFALDYRRSITDLTAQKRLHEVIQPAVEHSLRIPDFVSGTMVLDHFIGL